VTRTLHRVWLLAAVIAATPASAQVALETEPAAPIRGSLIRLRVTPAMDAVVDSVEGELAGEPLHFRPAGGLSWTSFAGIPISGGDSVPVTLVLVHGGARDTVRASFAAHKGDYGVDRLRVAPQMAEPDSAARRRIAREIARARAVSRAAHATPRLWTQPFLRPTETRITSDFGTGREFNGKVLSRHLGTDFEGRVGDPVRATNRGRVVLVAHFYLAGRVLYLDHGEGIVSAYFHLSKALVNTGDQVEPGQVIGAVGRSGRVTGPHLHWVMRYGGITVDPISVLKLPMVGEVN
jgi:murein DD-endopeptidase MepM/ murein hydrolase activator NlpD